ncbi:MAG: MFS transporter [Lactobacillus delbrueckii]|nr:MFS transporter [Lactobacillus delbrueckii]MDY5603231.1 MFS transporter [Lactobacillus delbrueckii]
MKKSNKVNLAIFSAGLMTFTGILNETSMNVTYPLLVKQFHQSLAAVQWITTAYLLTVTIVMGATAYLLKRFPARWLHLAAGLAFICGCLLCALTSSFPLMLVGRIIQGIATGFSTPIMFQLIFTQVPKEKLGLMTGFAGMIISLAPALGPTYGGLVVSMASWRLIFWLLLPLALFSMAGGQLYIRNQVVSRQEKFDAPALILLGLTLFTIIYALSLIGSGNLAWILLLAGVILFVLFVFVNKSGDSHLLNLSIFKEKTVCLAALTYFCLQLVNIGLSVALPVYAQYTLAASSLVSGLILLPGSLAGAIVSPLAGQMADNRGFKLPMTLGGCLFLLGNCLLLVLQPLLSPVLIILCHTLVRSGFNLSFANTISNTSTLVEQKDVADVNSSFNMIQQFAGSVGVSLATALISFAQKNGQGSLAQKSFQGGRYDFILFSLLALTALLAIWRNFQLQQQKKP